jgi:hypothetical protein
MLIHVDLNDAAPDFDQYYYVDWSNLPSGILGWVAADTYYMEELYPWFIVGPNYKQLPPWTLASSQWRVCLLDYSNLSSGKIIGMDYLYY